MTLHVSSTLSTLSPRAAPSGHGFLPLRLSWRGRGACSCKWVLPLLRQGLFAAVLHSPVTLHAYALVGSLQWLSCSEGGVGGHASSVGIAIRFCQPVSQRVSRLAAESSYMRAWWWWCLPSRGMVSSLMDNS